MTTLSNDVTLMGRCKNIMNIGGSIIGLIFASALIHWGLSYSYYKFCIGHTLAHALMSMFNTGGIGCQIIFRAMRITHYEYMKQIMSLFNLL